MPRVGRNPMKEFQQSFVPKRVSICTIVYIPQLTGYWEQSLDVLKLSLDSMRANSGDDCDLVVLDNGSCAEVQRYLEQLTDEGAVDILIRCHDNHGKLGAWNVLFPACPGEFIAYADSDVFVGPGWIDQSLRVFAAFDNVGMVTGRPMRTEPGRRDGLLSATLAYAEAAADVRVERGDLIPQPMLDEHEQSLGRHFSDVFNNPDYVDVRMTRRDVTVYASASHFQFVMRRDAAVSLLPLQPSRSLGGNILLQWDQEINRRSLLRVSLAQPFVWHLGNTLTPAEFEKHRIQGTQRRTRSELPTALSRRAGWIARVLRRCARGPVRRLLERVYLTIFDALK